MIRFEEWASLAEMPLPSDWDAALFNPKVPFAKRVAYAKSKAQRLGTGSGRIAFVIPYEGRKTVLKIAKNKKGAAQNRVEIDMLNDYYLNQLELFIPMIDGDEESGDFPTWVHVEFAEKCTPEKIRDACYKEPKKFKTSRNDGTKALFALKDYADITARAKNPRYVYSTSWHNIDPEAELSQKFVDFAGNYPNHPLEDFTTLDNWGIWKNKPTIIDIGLSTEVWVKYYK